jgi:hypothetical protein
MTDIHNQQTIEPFVKSPYIGSIGVDVINNGGGGGGGGAAGSQILYGTGEPQGATGVQGDTYIRTTNGFVYTKTNAVTWTYQLTIVGPTGANGPAGPAGEPGTPGPVGQPGAGVPTGGAAGQILAKTSGSNYDTQWVDAPTGGGGAVSGDYVPLSAFPVTIGVQVSSQSAAVTPSTTVPAIRIRTPYAFNLNSIQGYATATDTTAAIIDIETTINGVSQSILGNRVQIDANEFTSLEAAALPTIVASAIAADQELRIFVDQASSAWRGLALWLNGTRALTLTPSAPGVPTIFEVRAGIQSGALGLWFFVPSANNSPITSYTVQYRTTGSPTWLTWSGALSDSTILPNFAPAKYTLITGLTNGTEYEIRVSATNGVGTSLFSQSSGTPAAGTVTAPAAPTINTVTTPSTGKGTLSVAFTAGSANNGTISNYQYSFDGTNWVNRQTGTTASPIVITGLADATAYSVRIRAVNEAGPGSTSNIVGGTTASVPAAPAAPTPTAGSSQVSLTWTAPANGGSAILDYVIQFSSNGGTSWTTFTEGVEAVTSSNVTGLTNGTSYVFRVAAVNAVGQGVFSVASSAVTPAAGGGGAGSFSKNPTNANSGFMLSQAIDSDSAAAYSAARGGTGSLSVTSLVDSAIGSVGQDRSYNSLDEEYTQTVYQAFLEFDTSGGGTVSGGVALKIFLNSDFSTTDFTIEAYARDYGSTLTTGDWMNGTTVEGLTPLAASISTSGIGATGSLKTLTLSGNVLRDAINPSGVTRIVLVSSRNRGNNLPSGGESVQLDFRNTVLEYTKV